MLRRSVFVKSFSAATPFPRQFDKILVANRGEIACRVIRSARKLGIKSVGIYSEADKGSAHTMLADESYCVGPPPSSQSYLRMDKIIEISKQCKAQAIHPGYGFLSENHIFADKLAEAGIVFVGPSSKSMKSMASKAEAKQIMINAGVPVTPGYHGEDQSLARLKKEAAKIEYPVMIKAVMGGGGKGMRIVESEEEFEEKLESSKRESRKHFGDDRVIIEKYIRKSRHVEVQVFGDSHGNAVYLFERDCSVQRRHQKILEEAPAPELSEEQRRALGEKAVAAAKAVKYEGAGTVEFIWDCETSKFYFMEMNTRLKVEHPVTEMITGVDLVEWQLKIASGMPLPLNQEQINRHGSAIEARIYAENTDNNFMPDVGKLLVLQAPPNSDSLRVEMGLRQGDEISVHYDPMIAKVIAHGINRVEAIKRLSAALARFRVVGVRTNIDFIQRILALDEFKNNAVDTGLIQSNSSVLFGKQSPSNHDIVMASLFILHQSKNFDTESTLFGTFGTRYQGLNLANKRVEIRPLKSNQFEVLLDNTRFKASSSPIGENLFSVLIDDVTYPDVTMAATPDGQIHIFYGTKYQTVQRELEKTSEVAEEKASDLLTPMPCKVTSIPVKVGDRVTKGSTVAILEAMKMEYVMKASGDGIIKSIFFREGAVVGEKQKLMELELA